MIVINTGTVMRTSIDDLTERITIVYQTPTRTSRGDIVPGTDVERGSMWAKILPIAASISTDGIEREAAIGYRVMVRYRSDIRPDDEVLWRGKRLRIVGTPYDAESRHIWTVLECREVVQDGKAQSL